MPADHTPVTKPQRDWLGHGIQIAVIGIPLVVWGISINTQMAVVNSTMVRQERDIAEQRQIQNLITTQLTEASKQLARIETQINIFLEKPRQSR
jgi:hypothetical protein